MDGTTADCVIIPIVVVIALAAWLVMVYWADSHPVRNQPPASAEAATLDAVTQVHVPRQAALPTEETHLARSEER
jgi:hypothetical protein